MLNIHKIVESPVALGSLRLHLLSIKLKSIHIGGHIDNSRVILEIYDTVSGGDTVNADTEVIQSILEYQLRSLHHSHLPGFLLYFGLLLKSVEFVLQLPV